VLEWWRPGLQRRVVGGEPRWRLAAVQRGLEDGEPVVVARDAEEEKVGEGSLPRSLVHRARRAVAQAGPGAFLAYLTISVLWYGLGVGAFLFATAPPSPSAGEQLMVIAAGKRVVKAWAVVFVSSQVTTGLRAAAAVALTPIFNVSLTRLGKTLRVESRWKVAAVVASTLCAGFVGGMSLLVAREIVRISLAL